MGHTPGRGPGDFRAAWADGVAGRRSSPVTGVALATLGLVIVVAIIGFGIGRGGDRPDGTVVGAGGLTRTNAPLSGLGTPPPVPTAVGSRSVETSPERPFTLANDPRADGVAVVCLDPGHGGDDDGFVQPGDQGQDTLVEAELNLAHARELATRLEGRGIVVALTRQDEGGPNDANDDVNGDGETYDTAIEAGESVYEAMRTADYDDLQARINVCNRAAADMLVSMHINGFYERETARGFETWYTGCRVFGDQSEHLAGLAYRALAERFDTVGFVTEARGVKNDCEVDVDASNGQLAQSMLMTGPELPGQLVPSEMPGVIVESLFVSNPEDAAFLASDEGATSIVDAYEDAILAFFAEAP